MRILGKRYFLGKLYTDFSQIPRAFPESGKNSHPRGQWTFVLTLPIIERNQPFGGSKSSAARAEIHDQSAKDRLSYEGQFAAERAKNAGPLGADANL